MCLLVEVTRRCMADVDKQIHEERAARREAEGQLAAELTQERAKRERLKTYMFKAHTGRYEARIGRLLRAVAYEREQAEGYRRTIKHLTDQLLDATGYQGEPLLPAARTVLGIEDAKEADA